MTETFEEIVAKYIGKTIKDIKFQNETVAIKFDDNSTISLWDGADYCCERRHTSTDDDIRDCVGGKLMNIEVADGGYSDEPCHGDDVHQIQFLRIITDISTITFVNHNEHNGYYGGFNVVIKENK